MELNPFVFNKPLEPDQLIDRDDEAKHLLQLAEGGHASRLSAPRRYGKTSLLRRVGRDAELAGFNYVEVDFYGALTTSDVVGRMEEAYGRLRTPLRRAALAAIDTLRPKLSIGAGPLRVEAQALPRSEANRVLAGLLDLPLMLFERNGTRTLIAFDEFQELLAIGEGIDGLFRSHIQRHGDAASYIFAGSQPGLMHQLFGLHERPFFGQARVFRLGPLSDADLIEYVGTRFEETGREAMPALSALLERAKGHPQRAMLLAHHLWEQTPRGGDATPEVWSETLDLVFEEHSEALEAVWDALGSNEQGVMAALAFGGESLFNQRTLNRFNLSKGAAQHARDKLAQMGHLHQIGGEWQLVDPLLAEWIVRLEVRNGRGELG
ncbi:MAG TPA: hypothetical protein VFX44_07675 [Solirubrobacterales bacterium]|nr:hypothetical protein [Solirubrobacterales bacterium]